VHAGDVTEQRSGFGFAFAQQRRRKGKADCIVGRSEATRSLQPTPCGRRIAAGQRGLSALPRCTCLFGKKLCRRDWS
jgi:hypothetical protein